MRTWFSLKLIQICKYVHVNEFVVQHLCVSHIRVIKTQNNSSAQKKKNLYTNKNDGLKKTVVLNE